MCGPSAAIECSGSSQSGMDALLEHYVGPHSGLARLQRTVQSAAERLQVSVAAPYESMAPATYAPPSLARNLFVPPCDCGSEAECPQTACTLEG